MDNNLNEKIKIAVDNYLTKTGGYTFNEPLDLVKLKLENLFLDGVNCGLGRANKIFKEEKIPEGQIDALSMEGTN